MGRYYIACGGTGGHLFPGLAVAQELRARKHEVVLFVSTKSIDAQIMSQHPEFECIKLPVIGWPGVGLKVFKFLAAFLRAYKLCMIHLKMNPPQGVIGMGGFSCAPLLMAASRMKILTFLHESNVIPGKVTRHLANRMTKVFLGFEECASYLPKASCYTTGTPVRSDLIKMDRLKAARALQLNPELKTLVVTGGSQGAKMLNTWVIKALSKLQLQWKNWQVIHLTGESSFEEVKKSYSKMEIHALVFPFCHEMAAVYSLADLVVSRAGASSLTEISFYGLPSILIPFPFAADKHQDANANIFVRKGATRCVQETKDSDIDFTRELHSLMGNDKQRAAMASAASRLNQEDVAQKIVQEVEHATS